MCCCRTVTIQKKADGADNWAITWSADDDQYAAWGDGWGFDESQSKKCSLGVARIQGDWSTYSGDDTWVGSGKSYGILAIGETLYMWVGPGSNTESYASQTLHRSTDSGVSWQPAGWSFTQAQSLVLPAFLQRGAGYADAPDDFVYMYAIRLQNTSALSVQKPGKIDLLRAPSGQLMEQSAYTFFAGLDAAGQPQWTGDIGARKPVFSDPKGVGWTASAAWLAPLGRYVLVTEHSDTMKGNLGIFDAPTPWGPWTTVGYWDNWLGFSTAFYWNFANKWLSADGTDFSLIFTGVGDLDAWNHIRGTFAVSQPPPPPPDDNTPPSAPACIRVQVSGPGAALVSWDAATDSETGVAFYRLERDGVVVAEPAGPSLVDTGLPSQAEVVWRVAAVNGAGQQGAWSVTVTATTAGALVVSDLQPAGYTLGTLAPAELVYVDRDYRWVSVAPYEGLVAVQTANDHKTRQGEAFVSFEVNGAVTVFVGFDDHMAPPGWLSPWTATGHTITSDDETYSVFRRDFPAGLVGIPGPDSEPCCSSYVIFLQGAAPAGSDEPLVEKCAGGEPPPPPPPADGDASIPPPPEGTGGDASTSPPSGGAGSDASGSIGTTGAGGGCSSAPGPAPLWWLVLLLAVGALSRGRRATRRAYPAPDGDPGHPPYSAKNCDS